MGISALSWNSWNQFTRIVQNTTRSVYDNEDEQNQVLGIPSDESIGEQVYEEKPKYVFDIVMEMGKKICFF